MFPLALQIGNLLSRDINTENKGFVFQFPTNEYFFFFPSFVLLLCLKSPHSPFRILEEQHSTTGGRQLANHGQPDSALGEGPFCLAHP